MKSKMADSKNIGLEVTKPQESCDDRHCAFHGNITIRGRQFICTVTKTNAQKTAVVEWARLLYIPKYQRYEKRKSRLQVHNPLCINVKVGNKVKIVECRPISKTKNFVIIERLS